MSAITVTLPDERLTKLREFASRLSVTPEELVRVGIEDLLDQRDESFERAVAHVLRKKAELSRWLA